MSRKKAGRKAGVPNKSSKTLREALQALRFNVPAELVKLYNDPQLELSAKLRLLQTILEYTQPRLKEQEVPTTPPAPQQSAPQQAAPTQALLTIVNGSSTKD